MTNLLWTFQEMTFTLTHTFFLLAHMHPRTHIKTRTNNHTPQTQTLEHTHSHSHALIWCLHFLTCILVHRPLSLSLPFSLSQHSNIFCSLNFWSYLPLYASTFSLLLSLLLFLFPIKAAHFRKHSLLSFLDSREKIFGGNSRLETFCVFFQRRSKKNQVKKRRLWTNLSHKG